MGLLSKAGEVDAEDEQALKKAEVMNNNKNARNFEKIQFIWATRTNGGRPAAPHHLRGKYLLIEQFNQLLLDSVHRGFHFGTIGKHLTQVGIKDRIHLIPLGGKR